MQKRVNSNSNVGERLRLRNFSLTESNLDNSNVRSRVPKVRLEKREFKEIAPDRFDTSRSLPLDSVIYLTVETPWSNPANVEILIHGRNGG